MKKEKRLIVLGGATGSGKTALAVMLAQKHTGLVILSADSRQIYKKLDIGSAKIGVPGFDSSLTGNPEPVWSEQGVSQFLIDIAEPNTYFSLADYQKEAYRLMQACWEKGKVPMLVGGTGLYLQAVSEGYVIEGGIDPEKRTALELLSLHDLQEEVKKQGVTVPETDWDNKRRLVRVIERGKIGVTSAPKRPITDSVATFVLTRDWETQREMAPAMVQERLDLGLVDEVTQLITKEGVDKEWLYGMGLSYRLVLDVLDGKLSKDELKDSMIHEFRQLMRRQRTWFKNRMPDAQHIDAESIADRIKELIG